MKTNTERANEMDRIERIVTSPAIIAKATEVAIRWAEQGNISIEEAAERACQAVATEVARNVR